MTIEQFTSDSIIGLHTELAKIVYQGEPVSLNLTFPPHGLLIKHGGNNFFIPFTSILEDFFERCEYTEIFPFIKST